MTSSEKFKVVVCPADAPKNSKEGACRALQTQPARVTSHVELGGNLGRPHRPALCGAIKTLRASSCVLLWYVGFPEQTNPDTLRAASPMCA